METPEDKPTISVKIRTDVLTEVMLKENGANILLVALPLAIPKFTALGFLWGVINNMTAFYAAVEENLARQRGRGIVGTSLEEAKRLGRRIMPGVER